MLAVMLENVPDAHALHTDWPATAFPPDLEPSMTSLREMTGDRPIDHDALLDAFIDRLAIGIDGLRGGRFDETGWADRQLTTGRWIDVVAPDGSVASVRALGVDTGSGALVVADREAPGRRRHVIVGEIRHVRLAEPAIRVGVARATRCLVSRSVECRPLRLWSSASRRRTGSGRSPSR